MRKILITGSAGFIGFHIVNSIIKEKKIKVIGLDNINSYYDLNLKFSRLKIHGINKNKIIYNKLLKSTKYPLYSFIKLDINDQENLNLLFKKESFYKVINLAAQAGVRYSLKQPKSYIESNINGFFNIIECCKTYSINHLIYASSSSVYGLNKNIPFLENDTVDKPISLYAATKKSNELLSYTYSHLYNLKTTGLRFFTVYGPWGRPDMAYYIFTKKIIDGIKINVFNKGEMYRDFTYIDDVINVLLKIINSNQINNYQIYNVGNNAPVKLLDFINTIEKLLNLNAKLNFLPIEPGDVYKTYANVDKLKKDFNYKPNTKIDFGILQFINWFKEYYSIK